MTNPDLTTNSASPRLSRAREAFVVIVLLALQCGQLLYGLKTDGMTVDEMLYIASGYRQLVIGDHRFGAEHPPIARLLTAVPLLPLQLKVRDLRAEDAASGWGWAHQFVHVDNKDIALLRLARIPMVVMSLLLSFVIWKWIREAQGATAALFALALSSFHTTLLAHGHLATTDVAGTLTMVATSYALWRWCAKPGPLPAVIVGMTLGIAFATRLTAVLLVPIILVIVADWWRRSDSRRANALQILWLAIAIVGCVPFVIWAAYGFRHDAWPGEAMPRIVPALWVQAAEGSVISRVLDVLKAAHALPAAYLASIEVYLIKSTVGHQGYLLGQIAAWGWPYYYVVAFVAKNTPGFLIAIAIAVLQARRIDRMSALHWVLPSAIVFLAASLSRVQVGERYILAVYAYVIPAVARIGALLLREKGGRELALMVLLLHAGPSLWAARDGHLSYFNPIVGREHAHLVLGDSNLDWGQDLPRLRDWATAHPDEPLHGAYFGTDDPSRYTVVRGGVETPLFEAVNPKAPFTGTLAVSPTLLVGLYPPPGMEDVYPNLLKRKPDDRAGVYLIYRLGPGRETDAGMPEGRR